MEKQEMTKEEIIAQLNENHKNNAERLKTSGALRTDSLNIDSLVDYFSGCMTAPVDRFEVDGAPIIPHSEERTGLPDQPFKLVVEAKSRKAFGKNDDEILKMIEDEFIKIKNKGYNIYIYSCPHSGFFPATETEDQINTVVVRYGILKKINPNINPLYLYNVSDQLTDENIEIIDVASIEDSFVDYYDHFTGVPELGKYPDINLVSPTLKDIKKIYDIASNNNIEAKEETVEFTYVSNEKALEDIKAILYAKTLIGSKVYFKSALHDIKLNVVKLSYYHHTPLKTWDQ